MRSSTIQPARRRSTLIAGRRALLILIQAFNITLQQRLNWTALPEGAPTVASLTAPFANFNLTASNAEGVGLIFVMNEVQAQTTATVTSATLTAG